MANQILAGAVVQAGQVIAGVDADNPPYVGPPVVERILFRSSAQAGQGYAKSISILDPVTMVSTPLPDPTGVNYDDGRGFGQRMASAPNGSLFAVNQTSDYRTANMDTTSSAEDAVYHGSIHIYDPLNLNAGPVHTIRHHQDENISGYGRNLSGNMIMTNTHLYVGMGQWFPGPWISDSTQRTLVQDGRVFKYNLSNLSAAPEAIESPISSASNYRNGQPYQASWGVRMWAYGDKIFVQASGDTTEHPVIGGSTKGNGRLYVYDADNFATGQHIQTIVQGGWNSFGSQMWFDGDDVWIGAPQPNLNYNVYDHDHGQLWKYSLSDLSAAPTVVVNPEDFRGSDQGGSNYDRFGQQVVFTDTKIIISSAHEYKDWPQEGYKGYIYIMNKDGSQKQTLTNLPPNHRADWTVFGRYMKLAAGKLLISRYAPYGQDTSPGGAYEDGNGELWIYDPENLGASPTLWDEAGAVNANREVIDSEMVVMNLRLPE